MSNKVFDVHFMFYDQTRDSIVNNFVINVYWRCLQVLCQIALRSIANYFRSYRKKSFGIKSADQLGFISKQLLTSFFAIE